MSDTFHTLQDTGEGIYREKMSKFISFAIPVSSVDEARDTIATYTNRYHDARHVCWAYMIGTDRSQFLSSDNGEPSGTAGKPILGQINSFGLTNIVIIVVRYFGGTLLGTGGLVRAYSDAVKTALETAVLGEARTMRRYSLTVPYALSGRIENWISQRGELLDTLYEETVTYEFLVPDPIEPEIAELTSGTCTPMFLGEEVTEI